MTRVKRYEFKKKGDRVELVIWSHAARGAQAATFKAEFLGPDAAPELMKKAASNGAIPAPLLRP
jgi:hypothetical protein